MLTSSTYTVPAIQPIGGPIGTPPDRPLLQPDLAAWPWYATDSAGVVVWLLLVVALLGRALDEAEDQIDVLRAAVGLREVPE